MKVERTICVPKTIEVDAQYVVVIRRAGYEGMGAFSPAEDWHWFALCGDNKELAENKKREALDKNFWVDVEIRLLTDEEIDILPQWAR